MIVIDGTNAAAGRLASYVAKELLKGEEVSIANCQDVVITGKFKSIEKDFEEKRSRYGSSQKGPHPSKMADRIVKRIVRGMLPNHREGRGREAWKRLKCYVGVPKELEGKKMIKAGKEKTCRYSKVKEFSK